MKTIGKSKIEWCSHGWNPWVGCLAGCHYCYAKTLTKRFLAKLYAEKETSKNIKAKLENFEPVFLPSQFSLDFPDHPAVIFINPLSDVRYWFPRVMDNSLTVPPGPHRGLSTLKEILQKVEAHPQHIFVALTKFYQTYEYWIDASKKSNFKVQENLILGLTYTKYDLLNKIDILISKTELYKARGFKVLWNIEPGNFEMLEKIKNILVNINIDWLIFGLQTPNRKEITGIEFLYLKSIIEQFTLLKIPVFTKGIKYPPNVLPITNGAPVDIYFTLKNWWHKS